MMKIAYALGQHSYSRTSFRCGMLVHRQHSHLQLQGINDQLNQSIHTLYVYARTLQLHPRYAVVDRSGRCAPSKRDLRI